MLEQLKIALLYTRTFNFTFSASLCLFNSYVLGFSPDSSCYLPSLLFVLDYVALLEFGLALLVFLLASEAR